MTSSTFRYLDPASITAGVAPWAKVDVDHTSYSRKTVTKDVTNFSDCLDIHSKVGSFGADIDVAGFAVYRSPSATTPEDFEDDKTVRTKYYAEVEALLRERLQHSGQKIKRIEIFDHTIRRHDPGAARQPVQQVHVDQTPKAAEARVRRHVTPKEEADALLQKRYQLINVWRPIRHPATDFPLAVIDYRTTAPEDFVAVSLLYPKRDDGDDDDRGKEVRPSHETLDSLEGYEVKGETYGVLPNESHKLYYIKDMTPGEAMFIKCFDSWGDRLPGGKKGVAGLTPHTAFVDPQTPEGTPGRESIEVRCLVFYE
ncbi:uncharacterized protein PODANS_1_40 [Podospora anserina S mat+]|uniref:Carbohydrate Esterase Family 3 n=1 Tax=Podospora anserina (strain S / ATCC MYA-4624 / DSM 980 / FGSC 10383) TaxID=515849 RepID=B2A9L4_PODAN|nr:uncharacterized protein PODANS_1_40 [Podospora anserina S mat+]CAP59761.1 unnamed protein product [Podospora anserina S mat+]CDP22405.1 Putative Carbohydrate Esterase Family 3 [Podospora anserina S mat+]